MPQTHEITDLLHAWSKGDSEALEKLIPLVDCELKRVAHAYLRRERPGHILQTTALMDEALIRLMEAEKIDWHSRQQFYALVARRMQHVLVDYAKRETAIKRGNRTHQVDLSEAVALSQQTAEDVLMLHQALPKLAAKDPQKARIVELRYFAGLTYPEVAELLRISESTVEREWNLARSWLWKQIYGESGRS